MPSPSPLITPFHFLPHSQVGSLATKMPAKHIAIVTSSTRRPRLNPTITQYVYDVLRNDPTLPTNKPKPETPGQTHSTAQNEGEAEDQDPRHITFTILDLAAQNLPLYAEPVIPATLPSANPTPHYKNDSTQSWSARVKSYDAFIFVTPQYNWSIPGSLKNALDSLFHEWRGKPAGIISYGGRGGGRAAGHLRDVLTGLGMRVVGTAPGLVLRFTGVPVGRVEGDRAGEEGHEGEEMVELDARDVEGWKGAGIEGMMRNLGMEIVCELDKE